MKEKQSSAEITEGLINDAMELLCNRLSGRSTGETPQAFQEFAMLLWELIGDKMIETNPAIPQDSATFRDMRAELFVQIYGATVSLLANYMRSNNVLVVVSKD